MTGGTAATGGLVVAGYQAVFADGATTTTTEAATSATTTSTSSSQCVLMSSVTEGPYHLDGALVRKDITEGKSGTREELRSTEHELAGRDARLQDEQAVNPCLNGCSSWHRLPTAESGNILRRRIQPAV